MPRYLYILENAGTTVRRGIVFRDAPPREGDPAFGTPGTAWIVRVVEETSDHEYAGTIRCFAKTDD